MRITSVLSALMIAASASVVLAGTIPVQQATKNPNNGSLIDSIHLFGNARLRYEYGDIGGLNAAYVGSLRTRLGVKTDSIHGFKFLAEGEHTWVLTNSNKYSSFPGFLNGGRSVIADPDNFELNRVQLSYDIDALDTAITVGRQCIKLVDERFIGTVGWRQNDQTFDAVVIVNKSVENLTITYAYVSQVNRIFGENTPASGLDHWDSDSHLVHLEYTGIEDHTLRAFTYLLDFGMSSPANSSNTFGVELQGKRELTSGNKLSYLVTVATQEDAARNPKSYQEYYYRAQIGVERDSCHFGIGAEILTSDGTNRFRFPLGTNHKFNGFADSYVVTPPRGLIDYYGWVGTKAFGFNHKLIVHRFENESGGTDLGWEVDYVAIRPIGDNAKVILKVAHLDGKSAQRDITRASAEINYSF